eukprot:TRINITY_DN2386_c0_g1_i4.p1 TRINITY_DN2386_c0_g1~~TRINITY_DN2386_c0_g1_i4.p1  ORF type:complete len:220 (+),score=70.98 TRINITY_DN2386_c0_g1_i4:85-744(+)
MGVNTPTHRRRKFASPMPRANRIGLPGSRRYNRWLNKAYLMEQEGELELEDFELYHKAKSSFSKILDEPGNVTWEPFVNVTEENQKKMMHSMGCQEEHSKKSGRIDTNEGAWENLDSRVKRLLLKNFDSDTLAAIDSDVREYAMQDSVAAKIAAPEDAYGRLLYHAICQIYLLKSHSVTVDQNRVLIIEKKTTFHPLPSWTIPQFLRNIRQQSLTIPSQ